MPCRPRRAQAGGMKRLAAAALSILCLIAWGQQKPADKTSLGSVTVAGSMPVEKSYRKMVEGMDLFDRLRAAHAPAAQLRFRLLPRKRGTNMDDVQLEVIGNP